MEKNRKTILVSILQVNCDPWREIALTGQEPTWLSQLDSRVTAMHVMSKSPSRVTQYFGRVMEKLRVIPFASSGVCWMYRRIGALYGNSVPDYEIGSWLTSAHPALFASSPETIFHLPRKELALFRHFLYERTEPYLFLTNTSSYVNTRKLAEFVESLPFHRYYGGRLGNFMDINYVSGSCRLFSRDVVNLLFENRARWNYGLIDDVAMGSLLLNIGVPTSSFSSLVFENLDELTESELSVLQESIHIRLKSGGLRLRHDSALMSRLHSRVVGSIS